FMGRPGFQAHRRGGRHWSPRFVYESHSLSASDEESTLVCHAVDEIAELRIETHITLTHDGVLKVQSTVENFGDSPLMLDAFTYQVMPKILGYSPDDGFANLICKSLLGHMGHGRAKIV
ncbi:MAG: hypothetical protein RL628_1952, partial [Actinomycetota bacterium]